MNIIPVQTVAVRIPAKNFSGSEGGLNGTVDSSSRSYDGVNVLQFSRPISILVCEVISLNKKFSLVMEYTRMYTKELSKLEISSKL